MSTAQEHGGPELIHGLRITPTRRALSDGSLLVVTTDVPKTAGQQWREFVTATFYGIFGRLLVPTGPFAAYIGETGVLKARPAASYAKWTVTLGRIVPAAMLLVLPPFEPEGAQRHADQQWRKLVEGRTVRDGNLRVTMTNTQSSPIAANQALGRADRVAALDIAAEITAAIDELVLAGASNPHPFPATTNKEQSVRVIRNSPVALDTFDVVRLTTAAGNPVPGASPEFTQRRDLNDREQRSGGEPRVFTCLVTLPYGGPRRIYYGPHLTKQQAITSYYTRKLGRSWRPSPATSRAA